MSLPGYDAWKTTDPALENEWDWILACENYEDSPEYATDLAQWLKEAHEEEPDETFTEEDYQSSYAYESIIEERMKPEY